MIQTSAYLSGGEQEYVIGVEGSPAKCHAALGSILLPEDVLVSEVSEDGIDQLTIVRDVGVLSKEELQQNRTEVSARTKRWCYSPLMLVKPLQKG